MSQQIVDRFTTDIWPAIVGRNHFDGQNSPKDNRFHSVLDPNVNQTNGDYGRLMDAVEKLGQIRLTREQNSNNEGLNLNRVKLDAITPAEPTIATLTVCYTYTHVWDDYVNGQDNLREQAASEVNIELNKAPGTATWMLHKVFGDRVVPAC